MFLQRPQEVTIRDGRKFALRWGVTEIVMTTMELFEAPGGVVIQDHFFGARMKPHKERAESISLVKSRRSRCFIFRLPDNRGSELDRALATRPNLKLRSVKGWTSLSGAAFKLRHRCVRLVASLDALEMSQGDVAGTEHSFHTLAAGRVPSQASGAAV